MYCFLDHILNKQILPYKNKINFKLYKQKRLMFIKIYDKKETTIYR